MNTSALTFGSISEYIAKAPQSVRGKLKQMRTAIRAAAPGAVEGIKYGMPTFMLGSKNLVHFAAFKNHVGFYPAPSGIGAYKKQLARYKTSKGAIQFPLDAPLPLSLVRAIVRFRVKEQLAKGKRVVPTKVHGKKD